MSFAPDTVNSLHARGRQRQRLARIPPFTDFVCLTPPSQRTGQGGRKVCPGKGMDGQEWTLVDAKENYITCNSGLSQRVAVTVEAY